MLVLLFGEVLLLFGAEDSRNRRPPGVIGGRRLGVVRGVAPDVASQNSSVASYACLRGVYSGSKGL